MREENLSSEMKVSWSTVMMWLSVPRIHDTDIFSALNILQWR